VKTRTASALEGLPGVRDGALPLKREAMVTSGAQAFFLDTGTELIFYR
jgi:hypothetical protein